MVLAALGVPHDAPADEAGAAVDSVPCRLWMYCDDRLRREVQAGRGGAKAPDAEEGAFLLDQVLVQDATWEFTHASATDGSSWRLMDYSTRARHDPTNNERGACSKAMRGGR